MLHAGLEARCKACGRRAECWGQGDYTWACVVPTRLRGTPGDVGRARAWPEHSLALQPCLRAPSSILSQIRDTRQGLGEGCSPGAPGAPSCFLFLLVPTPLSPGSVHGKNAVSSEWGPRVTGGGSPSCMAPGVRDPLPRPRLLCLHPCLRLCPPGPGLTTAQDGSRAAAVRQTPGHPSPLQVPLSPPPAGLCLLSARQEEASSSPTHLSLLSAAGKTRVRQAEAHASLSHGDGKRSSGAGNPKLINRCQAGARGGGRSLGRGV